MAAIASAAPVIIEAAINGATTKERTPKVPRSPAEVAADAIACLDAGATIVHNHTDDPILDMVTPEHDAEPYIEAWREVLSVHPEALLYPTMTGGGAHTTVERRYGHLPKIAEAGCLTMGIVDPGSVNLGRPDADGTPAPSETVYLNTAADIRYMVDTCNALEVPINFSIFDASFLRVALSYVRAGRVACGGQIKLFFGVALANFGLPPTRAGLGAYVDLLEGCPLTWSVALPGGDLLSSEIAEMALECGGHLRVGLEDYAGPEQPSNVDLVERARTLVEARGRSVATVAETHALLRGPS